MKDVTVSVGPSFGSLLFLVFLTLKLCNVITWSWWWVTAPLWAPILILIAIAIVAFIVVFLIQLFKT